MNSDSEPTNETCAEDENNIITVKETIQLFSNKEYTIVLLRNILRHGYSDLSFSAFSGMSIEEIHVVVKKILNHIRVTMKDRPSLIHWLRSGLFESTDICVPLALLFIEWYEQHPSNQESDECNFREIYHFLYKVTMNQPVPSLSHGSAKVLHALITDIAEEVWPDSQRELLAYLTKIHKYSRPNSRRMYPGKRTRKIS